MRRREAASKAEEYPSKGKRHAASDLAYHIATNDSESMLRFLRENTKLPSNGVIAPSDEARFVRDFTSWRDIICTPPWMKVSTLISLYACYTGSRPSRWINANLKPPRPSSSLAARRREPRPCLLAK
jgi:hypothetical protein